MTNIRWKMSNTQEPNNDISYCPKNWAKFFFINTSWELLTFPKLGRQWEISFSVILYLHRGTFHISFTWIWRGNTCYLMGLSLECDVLVENFNISFIGSLGAFLHTPKYFSFYYWHQLHDLAKCALFLVLCVRYLVLSAAP